MTDPANTEAQPLGDARLVLHVDQGERRWGVCLPDGVSAPSLRVAIAEGL